MSPETIPPEQTHTHTHTKHTQTINTNTYARECTLSETHRQRSSFIYTQTQNHTLIHTEPQAQPRTYIEHIRKHVHSYPQIQSGTFIHRHKQGRYINRHKQTGSPNTNKSSLSSCPLSLSPTNQPPPHTHFDGHRVPPNPLMSLFHNISLHLNRQVPLWGFQLPSRGAQGIPPDVNTSPINTVAPNDIISLECDFIIIIMISIIEAQPCSSALINQERPCADPSHKNRPFLQHIHRICVPKQHK